MKLHIHPTTTIGQLQGEFVEAFPFVKPVFFSKSHKAYKSSNAKFLISKKDTPLVWLNPEMKDGVLFFEAKTPVWEAEQLFEHEFGLHVQLFRKSGKIWLETSVTDNLSIEQQNAKGRASEHFHDTVIVEPMAYREQFY